MKKIRTTLKIEENLKKEAELRALKKGTTLQNIFNKALKQYLNKENKKTAKKIVFQDAPIDKKMGNLSRQEIYEW